MNSKGRQQKKSPVTFRHSQAQNHQKKRNGVEVQLQKEFFGEQVFELLPKQPLHDSWK